MSKNFRNKVVEVVKEIPLGDVMTYGEVAKLAGNSGAARAVGTIMASNGDNGVPCHRVIRSDGSLGPYNGLLGKSKAKLLKQEGYVQRNQNR